MPIIKSAKKRMVQAEKHRLQNVRTKKSMRESVKAFIATLEGKSPAKVSEAYKEAQSAIDTAVKKNIIHKNTAARKKAALSAKAKAAGAPVAKKAPAKKAAAPTKKASKPATKPAAKKAPAKKPAAKAKK